MSNLLKDFFFEKMDMALWLSLPDTDAMAEGARDAVGNANIQ